MKRRKKKKKNSVCSAHDWYQIQVNINSICRIVNFTRNSVYSQLLACFIVDDESYNNSKYTK